MPTIFDGVRKMTDDEIRMQIALLKNVTMMNVAKETGNRLLGGLAGIANAFTEAFSNKTPFNYQAEKVSDMVKAAIRELNVKDRAQLEYELKKCLVDKCIDIAESDIALELKEDISEERLSFIISNEAAKAYASIQKYESPATKIDDISIQYNKNFLSSLHNMLISQSVEEVKETDRKIQIRLNEVPMETKRSLQKALMPKEFSGYGIGRILRLEKSVKYLEFTVTYLGVDCFDVVSVTTATAFSAVRNLKRVSRILLAQFVWKAHEAHGDKFSMDMQLLPSYISMNNYKEHMDDEKEFRAAISRRVDAQKRLEVVENEIKKIKDQIIEAEDRLELDQREYDEAQMRFMSYENQKDEYIAGKRSDAETKKFYSDVNETKRNIDRSEAELLKKKSRLKELSLKLDKKESERNTAKLNCEVLRQKTDAKVSEKSEYLKSKWRAFFFRFEFEQDIYENVVLNFLDSEIVGIEEMLKEMHDCIDISSFCYKKSDYLYENVDVEKNTDNLDIVNEQSEAEELIDNKVSEADQEKSEKFTVQNENVNDEINTDISEISSIKDDKHDMDYMITYCNAAGKNVEIQYKEKHILKVSAVR